MTQHDTDFKERHILQFQEGQRDLFLLEAAAYSIGRGKENAIVLDSPSVSRQHALLLRLPVSNPHQKYEYRLVDGDIQGQASKNGTYINGKACAHQTLKDGDTIAIGHERHAIYTVLLNDESESEKELLNAIQYHSIKLSVKESKETIVSESVGRLEKETLPEIQPSEEKVSASFRQTTFQTLKQDMKRILQRKIF